MSKYLSFTSKLVWIEYLDGESLNILSRFGVLSIM